MKGASMVLDSARGLVRNVMDKLAAVLNALSGGRISPDMITILSLLGHLPIAWFIAHERPILAAGLLVVFGLMDSLDGALARLQKRASPAGMLLDATTDRMKEVILYIGVAARFIECGEYNATLWAVAAVGGSLLVSYVKAKGETAVAGAGLDHAKVNRLFADGLMRYEVRMFVLIGGLLSDKLIIATAIIAVGSLLTAVGRLWRITRSLK